MSKSIAQSTIPFSVFICACLLTGLTVPASAASMSKHKHSVYVIDQGPESPETQSSTAIPDPESSKETRTAANDAQRMKVNVGEAETINFQDFYPFPEPAAPVQTEVVESHATLYWIGAAGAALAAGVAAWFIFSSEPETQQTAVAVP